MQSSLADRFAEMVSRYASHPALRTVDMQVSYADLNHWSNRLAHVLLDFALPQEAVVAVSLPRSIEQIVALLGVMKAGAVYVWLDPAWPQERLHEIVADTQAQLVIGPSVLNLPTLHLDDPRLERASIADPSTRAGAEQLLYIAYTSGSSGRPQGVCIEQRGVLRLVADTEQMSLNALGTCLYHFYPAFDAAVLQTWLPLLRGACIEILEGPADPPQVAQALKERSITDLSMTALLFQMLMQEEPDCFASLAELVVGGEALSLPAARQFLTKYSNCRLINSYGPTENTVVSTYHQVSQADLAADNLPLGKPVRDTQVWILDPEGDEVLPIGQKGEICLSGVGLAREYLHQPQLMTAKFIHPHTIGKTLYRSGDLGSLDQQGRLNFHGRLDRQLKIRGYRVEPSEIETALRQLPNVREALVALKQIRELPRLIAYLQTETKVQEIDPDWLSLLAQKLPAWCQPDEWMLLDKIPRNRNGKVNYAALPLPRTVTADTETSLEVWVQGLWRNLLGCDVKSESHFFQLGGHSLQALDLIAQLQERGFRLSLAAFYKTPILADLVALLQAQSRVNPSQTCVHVANQTLTYPLSPYQQSFWHFHQLYGPSAVYNIGLQLRWSEEMELSLVQGSVQALLERHPVLSSRWVNGQQPPCLQVQPFAEIPLQITRLLHLSPGQAALEYQWLAQKTIRQPFELQDGQPLMRLHLFQLPQGELRLLLVLHHILGDARSFEIFAEELVAGTQQDRFESESLVPEFAYADFAHLSHRWMQSSDYRALLARGQAFYAHWQPLDWPQVNTNNHNSFEGREEKFQVSAALSQKLKTLARHEGVSLSTVLLAAYALLLRTYTQQDLIPIGLPCTLRDQASYRSSLGYYVNALPVLLDFSQPFNLRMAIQHCHHQLTASLDFAALPSEKLLAGHSVGLQTLFVWREDFSARIEETDHLKLLPLHNGFSPFPLSLILISEAEGLSGAVEYRHQTFPPVLMQQFVAHYLRILKCLSAEPEQKVQHLDIFPPHQWPLKSLADVDDAPDFLARFEHFASERPALLALFTETGRRWTYAELNTRSNHLAHYLVEAHDLKPGQVLAVAMPRSPEIVVALLACLKAGAVLLLLDPEQPVERQQKMLHDAQAELLLASDGVHFPIFQGRRLSWQRVLEQSLAYSGQNLHLSLDPESRAYLIFTSGSTGRPKGVAVSHRALNHRLHTMTELYGLHPGERIFQFLKFSFDVGLKEVFVGLYTGCALYMPQRPHLLSPTEFNRHCQEQEITLVHLPPAYWYSLIQGLRKQGQKLYAGLKLFVTGGDSISLPRLREWAEVVSPELRFLNEYGPAEATITATVWEVKAREILEKLPSRVMIGTPLKGVWLYVLNPQGQPVPAGIVGELYIGGTGLAEGYLQLELNRERFLPDPVHPDRQVYKTGDLVRWWPSGELEFMGRVDRQFKLRGHRIEAGEIEHLLMQVPGIENARVQLIEHSGQPQLAAWLQIPETASDTRDWGQICRTYLNTYLPRWMIPLTYQVLPVFPLTANGKVDLQALPRPSFELERLTQQRGLHPQVQQIYELWCDCLGIPSLDPNSDFFELGGHSILVLELLARMEQELGLRIPVMDFLQNPTLNAVLAYGHMESQKQSGKVDPRQDLRLPLLKPATQALSVSAHSKVLMTGATGFLGAYLLAEILRTYPARVYCLIRAASLDQARQRIRDNLEHYQLWHEAFAARIIAVPGNLQEPNLGLSPERYEQLAQEVDVILHNAAQVNLLASYSALRSSNVLGTHELIKLACLHRAKAFHYISSVGIFPLQENAYTTVLEEGPWKQYQPSPFYTGYARSKWVSEQLLQQISERGLPVRIYRPGRLSGDSSSGLGPVHDLVFLILQACVKYQVFPKLDMIVDMTPVDYTGRAVTEMLFKQPVGAEYMHVTNPHPVHWAQLGRFLDTMGYEFRELSIAEWIAHLQSEVQPTDPIYPLLPVLSREGFYHYLSFSRFYLYDTTMARRHLESQGIYCPPVSQDLLELYFLRFMEQGVMAEPGH